ncbi:MFS transporter [Microlunatus elymi]|uniref:MFS transporter n=1 Tax=Microlunatus elymi TaxID=2596828 RepID=A0A516Q4S4_9ACTN|nr:MFS transporter [Microlunatus elymi]QDP98439.1 MFS transporter [Microlunatus elymi]
MHQSSESGAPAGSSVAESSSLSEWQNEPRIVSLQRRSLVLLIVGQVLGSFGMGASPSVGILLAEEVTGSETLAGLARTSATLGAALLGIPLALLATRGGRRIALSAGWFLAALGAVALICATVTDNIALLIGGMLLFGAGTAAMLQSRFAATDLARPLNRGRTLSLVVWCGTLGSVLGPNLGEPGTVVSRRLGLPPLAGAFVIALVMLIIAGLLILIFLRPDPLLTATEHEHRDGRPIKRRSIRQVFGTLWSIRPARFALVVVIGAHLSMVSLMTMTPVQMHHHGSSLTIVGITISIHVLGMFALSPLVGWASDRVGPVRVIMLGQLIFIGSSVAAMISGGNEGWTMISLFLLGLGWSCGTVPGSILLSESVPADVRTSSQGMVDTAMNGFAALAALISGPLFALVGFGGLSLMAVLVAIPLLAYAVRIDRAVVVAH